MSARRWRWPPGEGQRVHDAVASSHTRREAAEKLGVSLDSLDHAVRAYGLDLGRLLLRPGQSAPPSGGVVVSEPITVEEVLNRPKEEPPPRPREEPVRAPPARRLGTDGVERRLILADLHMPVHSVRDVACALELARVLQPHVTVVNGDLLNLSALSHHAPYSVARETFEQAATAGKAFLRALRRAVGGRIYYLLGNHEKWAVDYEIANPNLEGTFSVPVALGVAPRPDPEDPGLVLDIEWLSEDEQPLILGPVAYLHGTEGGMHFAKRYAETVGPRAGVRHVVVGHHHAFQHYSHKNGVTAWGCGHLADDRSEAFDYAKPPRGWERGVLVQDVRGELVTTTKVEIRNGTALFGGRLVVGEGRAA